MERQIITVDVQSMFETLDFGNDQYLRPRHIVMVPTLGGQGKAEFLALGDVVSPGFHPWSQDLDLIRAVTRVGGISKSARWDSVRILRPDARGNYAVIPVNLARLFGAADMSMNVKILAGDILFVPSAEHSGRGQVFLLGEVAKPGAIQLSMNDNDTLAKTILANGGFGKFANDSKVRLLRTAPDGSKQTLFVDVGRILKTGSFEDDVPLENGDVVIVSEKVLSF
jgi:protein involved in polysaccharide export with SLBB domain